MSINASGLFSTNTTTISSAAAYWKPVTPPAAGTATAIGGTGDTVAVSKLGQALTGRAADAFQSLNPKARQMLEDFVNAGMASAEDVVQALKFHAAEATFDRYLAEAPKDKEDFMDPEIVAKIESIRKRSHSGQITTEDCYEQGMLSKLEGEHISKVLSKRMKEFSAFDLGPDDPGGNRITTDEGRAAAEKLGDLGFDPSVFRGDFRQYAKTVDLPGIGRSAPQGPMPASSPASAPQAAQAASVPAAAAEEPPAAADPAATVAGQAAPAAAAWADPTNGQTAATRLQAALNTGAAAGAAANGQSAVTLLQSALGGGAAAPGLRAAQQPAGNPLLETLARSLKPT